MNLLAVSIQPGSLVQLIATALAISIILPGALSAQEQSAWYLHFSMDAERRPVFCGELDSAARTEHPRAYKVSFDSLGRPEQVNRMFFRNLDSRAEWTIMKFRYDTLPSGAVLTRRTWHNPSGFPLKLGIAHGEDVIHDSVGKLLLITAIDSEAQRVERVNAVTKMTFRPEPDGSYMQGWRYSNNKQFSGSEEDRWGTQFAPLDEDAWFRFFTTDERGFLIEERPADLAQKPVSFPGGEMVRRYERNECGQPITVRFFDLEGNPMADASGVARIEYEYDNALRLVSWSAYDMNGKPAGREAKDNAARMVREYRQFDGVLLREVLYDASGEEINLPASDEMKG